MGNVSILAPMAAGGSGRPTGKREMHMRPGGAGRPQKAHSGRWQGTYRERNWRCQGKIQPFIAAPALPRRRIPLRNPGGAKNGRRRSLPCRTCLPSGILALPPFRPAGRGPFPQRPGRLGSRNRFAGIDLPERGSCAGVRDEVQDRILHRLKLRTAGAPCERQVLENRRRRGRVGQGRQRRVRDRP